MSLNHDFILAETESTREYCFWEKMKKDADRVVLHDDIVSYIYDSLLWIPVYNGGTARQEKMEGFNRYGVSIYKIDAAQKIINIFGAWALLFAQGDEVLRLTGGYSFECDNPSAGGYEKIEIARNVLIETCLKLAHYGEQVLESQGDLCIVHLGV
jgi:hypothetical protein